ncbi:MAG: hypothetical protein ABI408_06330 [Gemmatimonadaceae bacterium]
MKKSLMQRLMPSRSHAEKRPTPAKKQQALNKINDVEPGVAKPRTRRTVGLTEARLRAANEQSWITSGKGWSNLFRRFTRSSLG